MKRHLSLIAIALLALPALAQDDFGGGGTLTQGDIDALLGGGGRGGGRGGRGGQNNIQSILPDATVMYNQLKDLLKNKKVPLAKEQEKPLQTLLNDEAKAVRVDLETQFPALRNLNQPQQQNNNNQNRGNQNNNQNNQAARVDAIVLAENASLLTQVKAELTPEQVAILDKAEKDKKCLVLLDGYQSFLNNGSRGNGEGANGRDWCTFGDSTVAQRLAPVRDLLKKERKPLTEAQDAKLASLVEARLPILERALRDGGLVNNRGGQQNQQAQQRQQLANNIVNQMFQQLGIQGNNNQGRGGNNNNFEQIIQQACAPGATPEQREQALQQMSQNFQGRGGGQTPNLDQLCQNFGNRGGRGGNNLNFNAIQTEVQKRNEVILDKVIAQLKPEQSSIVKKLKYEQIKSKGGAERIRGIMEEEGTPLTAEQVTQIQNLFTESNNTLRQVAQQLVLKAMETNPPPQQAQNQNQNQNRGNQGQPNPTQQYQQQMIATLLPQVSKQRAQIENATMNSVMRILTPSQVASYKINLTMPPL